MDFYKDKCIICLLSIKRLSKRVRKNEVKDLTTYTWDKIQTSVKKRRELGDAEFNDCMFAYKKYKVLIANALYHLKCYQKLTNRTLI